MGRAARRETGQVPEMTMQNFELVMDPQEIVSLIREKQRRQRADATKWVGVYDMSSTDDQIAEDLKAWFAERGMLV